ncbi:MAG: polyprenyl synthetase family protein [Acidilobaceae archaeon]
MVRSLEEALQKYSRLVDHFLFENISGMPEELYRASLHLIKAGGKRLRPALTLLTARMLGGVEAESRALPLAAAVEVAHTFTLIHDDIIDMDDYRRGVPTVHKLWGVDWAVLAGDLLHAYAYKFIVNSYRYGLTKAEAHEAMEVLTEAGIKISRGQAFDMLFEKTWDVTVTDYLTMVYHKTGAMMEASGKFGAIAARASGDVVELMGQYGAFVGVAFQIRDDYLGVFGDPAKTGKPVYSDLRRAKKTFLVLYALSVLDADEKKQLMDILTKGYKATEEELRTAAELIKKAGADVEADRLARVYVGRAKEILMGLSNVVDKQARKSLEELADYAIEREK